MNATEESKRKATLHKEIIDVLYENSEDDNEFYQNLKWVKGLIENEIYRFDASWLNEE